MPSLCSILLLLLSQSVLADIKWLPVIATSPETGFQYGALLLQNLDEQAVDGKLSSIQFVAINSTESQQRLIIRPTLYYREYKLKLTPVINYSSFPEKFYGLGNDTDEDDEEDFSSNYLFLKMLARYNFYSAFHVQAIFSRDDRKITEFEDNKMIDALLSSNQLAEYTLNSQGIGFVWDTRDQPRYPDSGYYAEFTHQRFKGDIYEYDQNTLDLRAFYSIGKKQVLATQLIQITQEGDNIPFINLSSIGGTDLVRGIFEGRYRAPDMLAAQIEYRQYGYDILGLTTGYTVFAATGKVKSNSPNDSGEPHSAVGIGGHFFFNPEDRTSIRLDVAYGDEVSVYLVIDQAF